MRTPRVGLNFLIGGYVYSAGKIAFDPSLPSIDLSCAEKWQNAEVQVRDATGSRLFSVPIVEVADLRAAA
jgi:hypothetical protein